jgi:hypothetical protein
MRQVAYPAALGSCALLARPEPVDAAEWSLTSVYSAAIDYDNDRRLNYGKASEAAFLTADLSFKRKTEDLELTFAPHYTWRRYTESDFGNGDDRSASIGSIWTFERSLLNASASYWDQSTLVSEVLETGLVSADTHRRQSQAGFSWSLNETERSATVAQVNYSDVSYYGRAANILSGYKYTSGSVGERFLFNERGSFTLSAYGSHLQSATPGNDSHEYGVQGEVVYAFSELTNADVSLGTSRRVLSGQNSRGTVASISLTRSLADGRGQLSAGYTRSLVPYGFGFFVEQQKYSLTYARPLTAYVSTTVGFVRVQNNETAVLLRLDRPYYNNLSLSFDWHLRETWTLGWRVEGSKTQPIGVTDRTLTEWRSTVSLRWAPFPPSRSW